MDPQLENNPININNPINQSAQPPKEPKDSHAITIAAMAVFVLLSLSAVAFLYYQNQQLKSMLASYQTPASSPTTSATADPTANWKTYTSKKANYSFKYPDSWPIVQVPVTGCEVCVEDVHLTPTYNPKSADSDLAVMFVIKEPRIKTIDDYKNIIVNGDSSIINVKDTTIDNENAISYKLSGGVPPLPVIEYVVVKNGYYYVFLLVDGAETNKNLIENQKTFDQILSTFQFTQSTNQPINQLTPSSSPSAVPNTIY